MPEETRVYLGRFYERMDRHGTKYFVGRLGEATVYLYSGAAADRGDPVMHLWLKQRREGAVPDGSPDDD